MTAKVFPIHGQYNREGSRLIKQDGSSLIITHRKPNPKRPNKAENFLLYVDQNGSKGYVSSLWETSITGIYSLEHGGQRFILDIRPSGKAEVRPKSSNSKTFLFKCP